jgi:phage recombination protein Bet
MEETTFTFEHRKIERDDHEYWRIVRETVCRSLDDDQFEHFKAVCLIRQLDPLANHIYPMLRWSAEAKRNVLHPYVTIDGARYAAVRTGQFAGETEHVWTAPEQGSPWVDVWRGPGFPYAAKVGVIRSTFTAPLYTVATWPTYAPKGRDGGVSQGWASKPDLMLAKCAEMLALRRAFPDALAGLYIAEEMEAATQRQPVQARQPEPTSPDRDDPEGDEQRAAMEEEHVRAVDPDEPRMGLRVVDPDRWRAKSATHRILQGRSLHELGETELRRLASLPDEGLAEWGLEREAQR